MGRRPNDTPYVVVNEKGNPLVQGTPKGNENQRIKNHWDRLLERVDADHPGFHRLPFKCLRKTGATYVRKLASAEVASMYLAHGERADDKDQLLSVYTSRPWRKVHHALGKLRARLLAILTSVADPWKEANYRMSPRLRKEVPALRQNALNEPRGCCLARCQIRSKTPRVVGPPPSPKPFKAKTQVELVSSSNDLAAGPQMIRNPLVHQFGVFAMDVNDLEQYNEKAMSFIPTLIRDLQTKLNRES